MSNSVKKSKDRPLLILDLNGILVYREFKKSRRNPNKDDSKIQPNSRKEDISGEIFGESYAKRIGNFIVYFRPGLKEFIKYCFENFDVAVWSSVTKRNIEPMVDLIFGDMKDSIAFVWDQDKCESVKHPDPAKRAKKPLFLKNLKSVWDEYPQYNKSNTVIIDDSLLKMRNNPKGTYIIAKEWTKEKQADQLCSSEDIMSGLSNYLKNH